MQNIQGIRGKRNMVRKFKFTPRDTPIPIFFKASEVEQITTALKHSGRQNRSAFLREIILEKVKALNKCNQLLTNVKG
jgi:hypothetical protein